MKRAVGRAAKKVLRNGTTYPVDSGYEWNVYNVGTAKLAFSLVRMQCGIAGECGSQMYESTRHKGWFRSSGTDAGVFEDSFICHSRIQRNSLQELYVSHDADIKYSTLDEKVEDLLCC